MQKSELIRLEQQKINLIYFLSGLYFFYWIADKMYFSKILFSNEGIWGFGSSIRTLSFTPAGWEIYLAPLTVYLFHFFALICCLSLFKKSLRKVAAVVLWILITLLIIRTPYIMNVQVQYIGWFLLSLTLYDIEIHQLDHHRPLMMTSIWIVGSITYFISGFSKLMSPFWQTGSALLNLDGLPLKTNFYFFLHDYIPFMQFLNYFVIAVEILFFLGLFNSRLKLLLWLAILSMHLGIVLTIRIKDISLFMILFHLYAFDVKWLIEIHFLRRIFQRIKMFLSNRNVHNKAL